MLPFTPKSKWRKEPWYQRLNLPDTIGTKENPLWLLTPEELEKVPGGTTLHCIDQTVVIVGVNAINTDTRGGYIAYGILESELTNNEGK